MGRVGILRGGASPLLDAGDGGSIGALGPSNIERELVQAALEQRVQLCGELHLGGK